jgi:hypothetical protein
MSFGLYLHIPFCVQHCHYCTFPIAVGPRSEHEPYVGRLLSEMAMAGVDQDPDTVYLGGGTPSLLSADQIARLLDGRVNGAVEVSIEMNPGTTSESAARRLREIGIDRVSLGAMGGSSHALVVELAVMAVFVLLAVVGFKRSSWLVVAGMAAHGLFDVLHPQLVHNAGVPQWWPAFCAAFDVGFAGLLAVPLSRVLSRIRHARST